MIQPTSIEQRLHGSLMTAVRSAQDIVVLASPFITAPVAFDLASVAATSRARWCVITNINPAAAAYGSLSLDGLRALMRANVEVRHLARLHGKVFFADSSAFVGSANLTRSGLGTSTSSNHEMTVVLTASQQAEAEAAVRQWQARSLPASGDFLDRVEAEARALPVHLTPRSRSDRATYTANRLLEQSLDASVWIKAEYTDAVEADSLWTRGDVADPDNGRPRYKVGDLLVYYAALARICNRVFEVSGPSVHSPERAHARGDAAARWPWFTPVKERMWVPVTKGVTLADLGVKGQSLQPGRRRMPVGGLATALQHFAE